MPIQHRLCIEYRVWFDAKTNQTLLDKLAEEGQPRIFGMFDGMDDDTSGPMPAPHDVTYELVMYADGERSLPDETRSDYRRRHKG